MASQGLVDHCIELLSPLGKVGARRMFGGHGVRLDGLFIALIAFERLYFKVDETTRPAFERAGCEPFSYASKGRVLVMSYWSAPDEAMESAAAMAPWARLALQAALSAAARKAAPKPRARSATAKRPRPKPRVSG